MSTPPKVDQSFFERLTSADYRTLAHAPYLKGLLKPFKGKGAWEAWASECEELRDELVALAQRRVLVQATAPPFSMLPIRLSLQPTGPGTTFLRWRNPDRTRMGSRLWEDILHSPATHPSLLVDLHVLEQERLMLNLQISALHVLARMARDCASKVAHTDMLLAQVLAR